VNTTAETLIGRADDDEGLLVLSLEGLGLSGLVDLIRGLTVLARVVHGALGSGELGGGDNLHGVCDLLDVSDGLETVLDLTESRIGGSGAGDGSGPGSAKKDVISIFLLFCFFRTIIGDDGVEIFPSEHSTASHNFIATRSILGGRMYL
jgi:hypothetical protein